MRILIPIVALLGLGCQLSPVVTTPEPGSGSSRYDDCRRASRDYCRDVLEVESDERDKCVAKRVYACIAGNASKE